MAVNKVPVLKRCRSLGLEPSYLGYDNPSKFAAAFKSVTGITPLKNRKSG